MSIEQRTAYAVLKAISIMKRASVLGSGILTGRLTDAKGRVASFKNAIVIMTSNVGSQHIAEMSPLGFMGDNLEERKNLVKDKVMEALKEEFRPEFLNRIDEVIIFNYLDKLEIKKIVELELAKVAARISVKGITMDVTEKAKELLAEKGFDPVLGARPLRRVIQRSVLDPLSLKIVAGEVQPGGRIRVDTEEKEIVLLNSMDSLKSSPKRKLTKTA